MVSGRKGDQIGLLLLGSPVSKSRQFDARDEDEAEYKAYENILDVNYSLGGGGALADDVLKMAGMEMLQALHDVKCNTAKTSGSGEFLDAMVIAIKMILLNCTSAKTGQPLKFSKRIVVFSDAVSSEVGGCGWSDELLEPVVEQLQSNGISTLICGFGFDEESAAKSFPESPHAILNRLINRTDGNGSFISGPDALSAIVDQKAQSVSKPTTTFRGNLVYGRPSMDGDYALEIPIYVYVKTSAVKLPSAKKIESVNLESAVASSSKTGAIERDTTHYLPLPSKPNDALKVEEDEEELMGASVDKEELVRAYRYGKHLVPFTEADEAACSISTIKMMEIISFTPSSQVPRHYFMSNVLAVVPDPSSKVANQKLGALAAAMAEKDHVAIVRYSRTEGGSSWKLGALTTCAKGYFLFNQVPFADDIRKWSFRPFDYLANDVVNAASGATSATLSSKNRVLNSFSARKHILDTRKADKKSVMSAMHALIDALDYTNDYTQLWPKKVKHVQMESMQQAIVAKTLGSRFDDGVKKVLQKARVDGGTVLPEIPAERKDDVDGICKRLQESFDLVPVPAAKVGRGRVRKVVKPRAGSKDLVGEEEVEFAFLDDDQELLEKLTKLEGEGILGSGGADFSSPLKPAVAVPVVAPAEDVDKEFEFLDF